MKFGTRALAAAVSAALLLALPAGCSQTGRQSQSGEPSAVEELTGLKPDDVLFTVDGVSVTAGDYCYWLAYSIENASYYLYSNGEIVWTDQQDGVPMAEFLKNDAEEVATVFALVEKKAADYGITLSEEDQARLEETMSSYVVSMGEAAWSEALAAGTVTEDMSDEDRAAWIQEHGAQGLADRCYLLATTVDGLEHLERLSILYENLQTQLYAEGGPLAFTDEAVAAYLAEQDMYKAKHILISTQDEEGNALDEEGRANARRQAENILAQLNESDDPLTRFDELMNEFSEDPGLAYYPDGYLFEGPSMVEAFTNGVKALQENEISGIVESEFGYHILLRLSAVDDETRAAYASDAFYALVDQWLADAQVEETDAFVNLNVQDFSDRLAALRTEKEGEANSQ